MNKRLWLVVLVIIILGGIGGKIYMDKREEDLQELLEIQKDLANYVYNNYRLYVNNREKEEEIFRKYDCGQGEMTTEEYLKALLEVREYEEITKIEFTGYSVSPMNFLTIYFTVNGVYEEEVSLSTISAETNKPIYMISDSTGTGPNYITKRKEKINSIMADEQIIYYEGGID
ncbi:hypothetical protein B834_565 [Enterococcus mundtii 1A]|uniref:hypothetical protein n=1 Tax=Enterococcus mundtii TaxID=53346 RepID=UPI0023026397|nr:hypothetical protein [Enterococcus mundtii]MDA9428103.1 hypothetical protein [Enterococcus mundtii 1A]MDO7878734.1 hypothetical protein [Enterococcus mundtii]